VRRRDGNRDDLELAALLLARRSRLRRVHRRRRTGVVAAAVVGVVVALLVASAAGGRAVLLDSCSLNSLQPVALGQTSFVYASNGSLLGVVPSSVNRQPLRLDQISPFLSSATVAIEDRRFWQHGALDYHGIVRALYSDLTAGKIVQGGSTITQELVRNLYIGNASRTLTRKVKEACLAMKLAQVWPKKRILNAYLNEVFYGRAAHGAQAAAETFFSTRAQDLTLAQAAMLAGLPQAPTVYDPTLHPAMATQRRDEVLRAMLDARMITPAQFQHAVTAPLGLKPGSYYARQQHPNFFGWAEQQLVAKLGARRVALGGLRVRTTLDPRMQEGALAAVRGVMKHPADPAAALVAIDPRTGAVRAMVGYSPAGRKMKFNLATQSTRTAGSSFKPFVLTTAILHGISLYSSFSGPPSLIIPEHSCDGPQGPWDVHNYADENGGYMNLLSATANSVNTIFAQLVAKVGPANVVPVAQRMGITTKLQPVCSITLGTQPVNPLEMTDAYATLAAHGVHHAPHAFELVRAPNGSVLRRLTARGDQAIPSSVADQVTYALEGVIQHGTGTAANFGRPAAGKTGTAENFQDAWFCGYVPQLATCVWVGYPKAEIPLNNIEGVGSVFGGSLPAEIWNHFMRAATANMPALGFPTPQITGTVTYGTSYYTPTAPTQTIIDIPHTPVPPPLKGGH
jgi:penicillin-binding protein 1A